MVLFLGKRKRTDDTEKDEFATQSERVKQYKDALRAHDRALKDLSTSITACGNALVALAASLKTLSAGITNATTVNACGTLASGLQDFMCGSPLEQLKEEAEHSVKKRFTAASAANQSADGARKRYTKSQQTLDDLKLQCEKLARKKETGVKEMDQFLAEDRKRTDQEGEANRLRAECGDAYHQYISVLGSCVTEDTRELSTLLHQVFSLLSYQFRKCHEHIGSLSGG